MTRRANSSGRNTWSDLLAQPAVHTSAPAEDMLRKLDWLQQAIILMRHGEVVPPEIATWLATGFETFINEGGDIGVRLGLRVRRGGRFQTVTTLNNLNMRNGLLVILVNKAPGYKPSEKIKAVCDFLHGRGPDPTSGFGSAVKKMLERIPAPIPGNRQLAKIVTREQLPKVSMK